MAFWNDVKGYAKKAYKYGKYANPAVLVADYTTRGAYKGVTGEDLSLDSLRNSPTGDKMRDAASQIGLPYYEQDRAAIQQQLAQGSPYAQAAQVAASPYAANYAQHLGQLQTMASGQGPSLAEQTYRAASQDALSQNAAMAHGGSAALARQAMLNQGRVQQGLTQGVTQARTAEQLGAISQYGGAINAANAADFQRAGMNAQMQQQTNLSNQNAYLDMLGKQLGLSGAQLQAIIAKAQMEAAAAGQATNLDKVLQVGSTVGSFIAGGPAGGAAAMAANRPAGPSGGPSYKPYDTDTINPFQPY